MSARRQSRGETAPLWAWFWDLLRQTEPSTGAYDVEVGSGYGRLSLPELCAQRPGGVAHVRWDPVPGILPITPVQRLRVEHVLVAGTPAGLALQGDGSVCGPRPA
ncbi:MAG: hypothetical protein MUF10_10485 [Thermoanaerobaculaceae bacterium]|jgi:hypothetical protein|nr:hypothetical protein [Thermoanaerobaculaceae bacterium]